MFFGFSEKKIFFDYNFFDNHFKLGNQILNFHSLEKKNCEILEFIVCNAVLSSCISSGVMQDPIILKLQSELAECFNNDISILNNLKKILALLDEKIFLINNLTVHLTMQQPKLCQQDINYKFLIRDYLADLLNLDKKNVVIQAGTGEKIGDTGNSKAIIVLCNISLSINKLDIQRIGFGFDRHRFSKDFNKEKILTICNQVLNYHQSISAHSDGDVVLHGLVNAIFSTIGLGDIGEHFPDTDPEWKNCNSKKFAEYAMKKLYDCELKIKKIDVTLIASTDLLWFIKNNYNDFMYNSKNILSNISNLDINKIDFQIRLADKFLSEKDEVCIGNNDGLDANVKIIVEKR